ncbi:hypothetical protein J6590_095366 [Homalodisca vitripennis]|nr:hypothetical protein J6590_095366 [Homalodisca vitripennis]
MNGGVSVTLDDSSAGVDQQGQPELLVCSQVSKNARHGGKPYERMLKVPEYLLVVVQDYLRDRRLIYEVEEDRKSKVVTVGTMQESIHGSDPQECLFGARCVPCGPLR